MDLKPFLKEAQSLSLQTNTGKFAKGQFKIVSANLEKVDGEDQIMLVLSHMPGADHFFYRVLYIAESIEMARLRNEEGLSLFKISQIYHCDLTTVRRRILLIGQHSPGRPRKANAEREKRASDMAEMRNRGWTFQGIAKRYGISHEAVRLTLLKYDIGHEKASAREVFKRLDTPEFRSDAYRLGSLDALAEKYDLPVSMAKKIFIILIAGDKNGRKRGRPSNKQTLAPKASSKD